MEATGHGHDGSNQQNVNLTNRTPSKMPGQPRHWSQKLVKRVSRLQKGPASEWIPSSTDLDRYILSGRVKYMPKRNSKIVRIFLSSTFTDMYVERNALFKRVYPRLQSYCHAKWDVDFQVVDMRWGVQSTATNDHSGAALCMAELKTCRKESLGPNFVLLLGQRYGTRHIPPVINGEEFDKLVAALEVLHVDLGDIEFLQQWYLCDTNTLPPVRRLQPLDTMSVEPEEFSNSVDPRLRRMLRAAADQCLKEKVIDEMAHRRYFWSVTDEEVFNGILNTEARNDCCLCFTRYMQNINFKNNKVGRFVDMLDDGGIDKEAQALRDAMHRRVYDVLDKSNITEFSVPWCDNGGTNEDFHAAYLEEFCEAFYHRVVTMIDKAANKDDVMMRLSQSSLLSEVLEHSHQAKAKFEIFQGRSDILEKIMNYIKNDDESVLLTIQGGSGFGKTSIIAMASINALQWLDDSDDVLSVRRFLGTTPDSTNIESLLRSIAQQVASFWNIRLPHIKDPLLILDTLMLCVPRNAKLVLFLDSLDQLSSAAKAHTLTWLPMKLPSNVKIVVSTLPEEHSLLDILKARNYPDHMFVQVDVLDVKTSLELLTGWLFSQGKKLSDSQIGIVTAQLKSVSQTSPLYIKLMFDILSETPSYMTAYDLERKFLGLDSTQGCIQYIIEQLRKKHGICLVDTALAFLHLSNQGLTESEIVHLLSLDDVVLDDVFQFHMPPLRRLPALLWTRIRHDVSEYIVERDANGSKVLAWYHRQFIEAGQRNFLDRCLKERATQLRLIMADYFMGVWANGKPKPFVYSESMVKKLQLSSDKGEADRFVPEQPNILSNGKPNLRKLTQLPVLLVEAGKIDVFLTEIVGSIESLVSMFETYTWTEIFELLNKIPRNGINDKYTNYAYAATLKCLLLSSATASLCPSSLGPLVAGRLLPFYGASNLIDHLLEDIYSKGLERNAFVVPHNQLEGFGSYLLFEMTNDHIGPCNSIREVFYEGHYYIMSVSRTAVLIYMQNGNIVMRHAPPMQDGDHFSILRSAEVYNPEFIAASLTQVPKVFVFAVGSQECTGNFDCRTIAGCEDFLISEMLAFHTGEEEIIGVWGMSLHGLLLYSLKRCELLYHFHSDSRIFAVMHSEGSRLTLLQAGKLLALDVTKGPTGEEHELHMPGSLTITADCFSSHSGLIVLATADNKLFLYNILNQSRSRVILDSPAHCITSRNEDLLVCTRSFVYCLLVDGYSKATVTWRICKRLDWAAYIKSHTAVGYRLGSISVLQVADLPTGKGVYEDLTFVGHAKPITDIIINKDVPTMFMTSSADGTIRVFDQGREINKHVAEVSKFDRMDLHIDFVRGSRLYAVSIAKDNRVAAVWNLSTGKIVQRLYHEGIGDLKEALVLGQIIVTVAVSGMLYVWNLDSEAGRPSSILAVGSFHSMIAKSEKELIILSDDAVTELSMPSGTIVMKKSLPADKKLVSHSWSTDFGLVVLVDPDRPTVEFVTDETCVQMVLADKRCLEQYGQQISSIYHCGKILVLAYAHHVVFYNYDKNDVLTSMPLTRPILLKSHNTTVGARSGLNVHFFDVNNGVTKLGSLKLSSVKDQAVLSSDGLHCLVTKLPKLLHLYRLSDMAEIGAYSCYGNIECVALTSDCEHALVAISDTRLLSFRIVDSKCKGHLARLQGILRKPSTPKEISTKKHMMAAAGLLDGSHESDDGSDDDENGTVAKKSADADGGKTENNIAQKRPGSININDAIRYSDEEDRDAKIGAYIRHVTLTAWKRHNLLSRDARIRLH